MIAAVAVCRKDTLDPKLTELTASGSDCTVKNSARLPNTTKRQPIECRRALMEGAHHSAHVARREFLAKAGLQHSGRLVVQQLLLAVPSMGIPDIRQPPLPVQIEHVERHNLRHTI